MSNLNKEYTDYINSDKWLLFRAKVIIARRNRCEHCKTDGNKVILQVHHLTYERLGHEELEDVELLCVPCHKEADKKRRNDTYKGTKFFKRNKK